MRKPSHRPMVSIPHGGTFVLCDIKPVGRAMGSGWCKYCYRTHRSWWLMPEEEYPPHDALGDADQRAILCGYCEHVSLACFADFEDHAA
jgi:hypothetical protein